MHSGRSRPIGVLATTLCLAGTIPTLARGAELYDIDLSGPKHQLNGMPAVGGNDGFSLIGGAPTVVSEFGPLTDRPLLFSGGGVRDDDVILLGVDGEAIYQIDFDLVTSGLKDSGYSFRIGVGSTPQGIKLDGTANRIHPTATWEEGKLIHVSLSLNFMTKRWTAQVDDVLIYDQGISGVRLGSISWRLEKSPWAEANRAVKVALDNVVVTTAVPESLIPPSYLIANVPWKGVVDLNWPETPGTLAYQIFRSESNDLATAVLLFESTWTSRIDQSILAPGKRYYYWVKSKSGDRVSAEAASANLIIPLQPPDRLTATPSNHGRSIELSWPASVNATRYHVYRSLTDSSRGSSLLATTSSLHETDMTALPGVRYFYWVQSANEITKSGLVSGTGMSSLLPVAWLEATRNQSSNRVSLVWNPVDEASQYQIYRSLTGDFRDAVVVGETDKTEFMDPTTVNGQEYSYWVVARSIEGITASPSPSVQGISSDHQPDLRISLKGGEPVGANLFNETGVGQSMSTIVAPRQSVNGTIGVSSIGANGPGIRLLGSRGDRQTIVRYRYHGNATSQIITGRLVILPSDGKDEVEVVVSPKLKLRHSSVKEDFQLMVQGISTQSPNLRDTVRLKVDALPRLTNGWTRPDPGDRR